MNTDTAPKKVHQGRNIKRLRELLGIKQESLAFDLGVSQATVSDYEQKEELDEKVLEKVSQALKVPIEAIKNMTDEATHNYINTFNDNSSGFNYNCSFNPLDKVVELYERLLKTEQEKVKILENKK
ncbi:helix-turn-helix transcriptional regulator [uncultured Apibacter sp.]|uniref:helix-turn-helix domain-containing protein n=1 Tax=uncultured Apibacter sp. TaxID=1778616 RepID=UPI0025FFD759|nr:helix-turn-helix transcriptional regulator [uncultured Apibacter sp.]